MNQFLENIDKQIVSNQGKNIFSQDAGKTFKFIDDTIHSERWFIDVVFLLPWEQQKN